MTDAAAEPLISSNREDPYDARYGENDAEDVEVDESALVSPGLFIWGLTICAGVSGLLFGYEYVSLWPASACACKPQSPDCIVFGLTEYLQHWCDILHLDLD